MFVTGLCYTAGFGCNIGPKRPVLYISVLYILDMCSQLQDHIAVWFYAHDSHQSVCVAGKRCR